MVIVCRSLQEFLDELDHYASEDKQKIFHQTVRVRIDKLPEQEEEVSFRVIACCTVFLALGPEHPVLMELSVYCGVDDRSPRRTLLAGTEQAEGIKAEVQKVCDKHGLRLGNGRWEMA